MPSARDYLHVAPSEVEFIEHVGFVTWSHINGDAWCTVSIHKGGLLEDF